MQNRLFKLLLILLFSLTTTTGHATVGEEQTSGNLPGLNGFSVTAPVALNAEDAANSTTRAGISGAEVTFTDQNKETQSKQQLAFYSTDAQRTKHGLFLNNALIDKAYLANLAIKDTEASALQKEMVEPAEKVAGAGAGAAQGVWNSLKDTYEFVNLYFDPETQDAINRANQLLEDNPELFYKLLKQEVNDALDKAYEELPGDIITLGNKIELLKAQRQSYNLGKMAGEPAGEFIEPSRKGVVPIGIMAAVGKKIPEKGGGNNNQHSENNNQQTQHTDSSQESVAKVVPKIHVGKQGKHMRGHNNFTEGRSFLTVDPAKLAERAGTGTPVGKIPRGQAGFKERIDFGEVIGEHVVDGVGKPTTKAIITYAKDGSIHIIPAAP